MKYKMKPVLFYKQKKNGKAISYYMNFKHSHLKINLHDWAQKVHSLWNKKPQILSWKKRKCQTTCKQKHFFLQASEME